MYSPTKDQKHEFINEIAPLAQMAYMKIGKVKPSVCIGMACVESNFGWGTNGKRMMYNYHAVMGHKVGSGKTATDYWSGKFFVAQTGEEYTIGVHTTIKAAFRAYDSLNQCIMNFYELLNTNLYKRVKAESDYATQMQQIKQVGYMTSSTEVGSVISIINQFKLYEYDGVVYDVVLPVFKTTEEIAKEVIAGKWGNGIIRRQKLKLAGYDYKEIQSVVNSILKRG